MPALTVRYFAAARAAAGVTEERLTIDQDATVEDVLAMLMNRHSERFAAVLSASSLLIDGVAAGGPTRSINGATELDVLPPFAGG